MISSWISCSVIDALLPEMLLIGELVLVALVGAQVRIAAGDAAAAEVAGGYEVSKIELADHLLVAETDLIFLVGDQVRTARGFG